MRIALGIFTHEANSFSPHPTDVSDFEARQLEYGDELMIDWDSARTEQAGALSVLTKAPECQVIPLLAARALSAAPIRESVFRAILDDLLARLEAALPADGVLLVLHGSMMSEDTPDASGEVLRRVRSVVGARVPIVGTLDLHANVTARMVREATALIGYHTTPHIDQYETGQVAAGLLLDTVRGMVSPTMALVRLPWISSSENCTDKWGPLAEVLEMVLALERERTILHAGIYPVQAWLDTEDVGSAVVVVTDRDLATAQKEADLLAGEFWARRERFLCEPIPPDEAVRRALSRSSGTVVFCDSADSTTSGSSGDSTAILQALLRAVPLGEVALLNVVDPEVVAQAIDVGVGATITVNVGGKLAPQFFSPVTFRGYVKLLSDGVFSHRRRGTRGPLQRRGCTVVLIDDGIHLVVMERAVSQWDPGLYRSLGEEPTDARIVQIKSPMGFRAAYEGICDEVMVIKAPGASTPDLGSLPWRHLPRPIYPLDRDISWP